MHKLATPATDMVGAGVQKNPIKEKKQSKKEKLQEQKKREFWAVLLISKN